MSGAGPLSAISGLAGGGGALGFLGGFGGGGGKDYSADFARIEAELAQINQRLAVIESKIDQLAQTIKANHEETMAALEAISFDVARTHKLLLAVEHDRLLDPCRVAAKRSGMADVMDKVGKCSDLLEEFMSKPTPTLLTLEANLKTANLKDSALAATEREKTSRFFLSKLAGDRDCIGILYPSATLDDFSRKRANPQPLQRTECSAMMARRELLEPGIISSYVETEQAAILASGTSATAGRWWSANGATVHLRWMHELQLLDDGIAQQTLMVGDLVLPELAAIAENAPAADSSDLSRLKDMWGDQPASILAENVARYWMWQKIAKSAGARTLYALAWNSKDDRFWYAVTGADRANISFSLESVSKVLPNGTVQPTDVWFITFNTLPKVPLPSPADWAHFELRWTNGLTDIVSARRSLLDQVAGTDYLTNVRRNRQTALDLVQAFVLAGPKQKR
jgi:hypothetical protein